MEAEVSVKGEIGKQADQLIQQKGDTPGDQADSGGKERNQTQSGSPQAQRRSFCGAQTGHYRCWFCPWVLC